MKFYWMLLTMVPPGVNCVLHRYSMMYAYFMMQFILSVILLPLCYYHVLQSFDGVKIY